ncbi:hypothetical protein O1L60_11610 [Streptomyces diastatochromogenes]|nr:hypothetical protein [Streptomyces diastatochromogenes]
MAGGRAAGPGGIGPAEVARFFAGLSPVRQRELARAYPTVVGNLDGAPLELRYEANARSARGEFGGARVLAHDPRGRGRWPWSTGTWRGPSTWR